MCIVQAKNSVREKFFMKKQESGDVLGSVAVNKYNYFKHIGTECVRG